MNNEENLSINQPQQIKASHAAPPADVYAGGDDDQGGGSEVNPGELGNNNEVDLDRSGPNEGGPDKEQKSASSGSAGSDTNRNAGGDVAGNVH